jgi:hypothetical protein
LTKKLNFSSNPNRVKTNEELKNIANF